MVITSHVGDSSSGSVLLKTFPKQFFLISVLVGFSGLQNLIAIRNFLGAETFDICELLLFIFKFLTNFNFVPWKKLFVNSVVYYCSFPAAARVFRLSPEITTLTINKIKCMVNPQWYGIWYLSRYSIKTTEIYLESSISNRKRLLRAFIPLLYSNSTYCKSLRTWSYHRNTYYKSSLCASLFHVFWKNCLSFLRDAREVFFSLYLFIAVLPSLCPRRLARKNG